MSRGTHQCYIDRIIAKSPPREGKAFENVELSAPRENPNVTCAARMNPDTGEKTKSFRRK